MKELLSRLLFVFDSSARKFVAELNDRSESNFEATVVTENLVRKQQKIQKVSKKTFE